MRPYVVLLAACTSPSASPPDDASTGDSTTHDAAPACDPLAPFAAPVAIAELAAEGRTIAPRLSADELTLVLSRQTASDQLAYDLFITTRASRADAFGELRPILQVNSPSAVDANPSLSADGLTLYFDSWRGTVNLYTASRASRDEDFGSSTPLYSLDVPGVVSAPFISSDNSDLWYSVDYQLVRARWNGSEFANPTERLVLTPTDATHPVLSADNLTLYIASRRNTNSVFQFDIWRSHRAAVTDEFPDPVLVPELSSPAEDYPGWLSPDGCRMYLASGRDGHLSVFLATR